MPFRVIVVADPPTNKQTDYNTHCAAASAQCKNSISTAVCCVARWRNGDWLTRQTCDRLLTGSTPGRRAFRLLPWSSRSHSAAVTTTIRLRFDGRSTASRLLVEGYRGHNDVTR